MAAVTEVSQINLIDFDVYGRSSNVGGALIHQNDFAISNAIIFFSLQVKVIIYITLMQVEYYNLYYLSYLTKSMLTIIQLKFQMF